MQESNEVNKRLPGFLLVGAAKSATSSLHAYLDQHPDIKMPSIKESWFFSFYKNPPDYKSPGKLSNLISELDEYLKLFNGAKEHQILGDACPSYLYTYEDTIRNIKQIYSETEQQNLKIIISLREPVSRALSQFYTFKRKVEEPLNFEQAIQKSTLTERKQENWNIFYDYPGFGLYSKQVEAFQQAFGSENVMIILFDDIHKDMAEVCRNIYEFVGVDANFIINDQIKHNSITGEPKMKWLVSGLFSRNKYKRMISALIPKFLRNIILYIILKPLLKRKALDEKNIKNLSAFFEQDIIKLEKLIGRDLGGWRNSG